MAFLKKIGTLFGRGKKPQKPSSLAPKRGTSQEEPEREHIENRLREIRAKWLQFEEQVRKGVNEAWRKVREDIAKEQPRFTIPPPEEPEPERQDVESAQWYDLISTNVDRIRYGQDDQKLQVIFKNGSLYQYESVEPEVFMAFLRAPSPGQYVWYVLRQYGYAYAKLGAGHATSKPANDRFAGQTYDVPEEIQAIQRRAGRKPAEGEDFFNVGTPVAKGFAPPPPAYKGSKVPRP